MLDTMTIATNVPEEVIPIIAMGIGGVIALVAIVFGSVKQMVKATAREKSRREIAAYVAEGSITPEDGERLIEAGRRFDKGCGG